MNTTAKLVDYKNLQPGQRFYYTGDQANVSGFGTITEVLAATKYTQMSYRCLFDDGRGERVIMHQAFSPSIGQRFKTIEQYNEERAAKMEAFYKQYPQLKK